MLLKSMLAYLRIQLSFPPSPPKGLFLIRTASTACVMTQAPIPTKSGLQGDNPLTPFNQPFSNQ